MKNGKGNLRERDPHPHPKRKHVMVSNKENEKINED